MAYYGSTQSSSSANPPILLARSLGSINNTYGQVVGSTTDPAVRGGAGLWYYATTDGSTDCQATAYFTDGKALGMRNGDCILIASATAAGSTTLGLGVGILLTTNSSAGFNVAVAGTIQSS
jgi:hypothetical protein